MSVQPSAPEAGKRPAMTMHSLMKMLADGEKITMLTAYDATFAAVADLAGADAQNVPDEMAERLPQMMGAMASMVGALDTMLPQLRAEGAQVLVAMMQNVKMPF